jgi:LPXTG-site transpeptidase (sortase) family protein
MRFVRLLLPLTALILAACGASEQAGQPAESTVAKPVAVAAPSPHLAATSRVLIDTPILDDIRAIRLPTPVATPPAGDTTTRMAATPISAPEPVLRKPARVVIPDIDMDRPLVAVGLDASALPIVPKHDAGWYDGSAVPGQGDNIVLWGHALRFRDSPTIPAPFGQLQKLEPGAKIMLYNAAGQGYSYTVMQQIWATPDQVEYILPQGRERLTMISCIGDKVTTSHGIDMTHRLVTIAEPTPQDSAGGQEAR